MPSTRRLGTGPHEEVAATVSALDKLLTVELSTLVLRYHRVPRVQKLWPSVNASADDLLLNGLRAVDKDLRSVHDKLAHEDVQGLAAQARYLELNSENS
jgi:hypothetical protein